MKPYLYSGDGITSRPGTVPGIRPTVIPSRPMRGRGRGAAGSRAAGGVGRGQVPGYIRTTPGYKKPGTEVGLVCSIGCITSYENR